MTPADEMGFDNQFEEQLRAVVKENLQQPRLVEDLHGSEDVQILLSRLDQETSERTAIYHRLQAIENRLQAIESAIKRRRSRGIFRYLVAIGIGIAATLGWQSYGETTKQMIATKAPELSWSPETKQMITGWMQQLGWTKQPASPESTVVSSVPETAQPIPEPSPAPARQPTPTAPKSRAPIPPH